MIIMMMMILTINSITMIQSLDNQLLLCSKKPSNLENHIKEIRPMIDRTIPQLIITMMNSIMLWVKSRDTEKFLKDQKSKKKS